MKWIKMTERFPPHDRVCRMIGCVDLMDSMDFKEKLKYNMVKTEEWEWLDETPSGDGWVRVEDELPKPEQKVFIVFNGYKENRFRTIAMYVPKFHREDEGEFEGELDFNEKLEKEYWPEGWYETMYESETCWKISHTVTHWTPLPSPPTA